MKHTPSACPKHGIIPGQYSILYRNSKKFLLSEDHQQIRNLKKFCGMEGAGRVLAVLCLQHAPLAKAASWQLTSC